MSESESKKITMEQLKEHSTHDDLWLLIDGKVYNVSKFLDEHPGGDEVLVTEAGKDATEAFEDVGHSEDARALLGPMLVGELEGGSQKIKTTSGAVTNENNTNVNSHPLFMFIPLIFLGAYLAYKPRITVVRARSGIPLCRKALEAKACHVGRKLLADPIEIETFTRSGEDCLQHATYAQNHHHETCYYGLAISIQQQLSLLRCPDEGVAPRLLAAAANSTADIMTGASPSRSRPDPAAFLTSPSKRTGSNHGTHDPKRHRSAVYLGQGATLLPDFASRVIIALDLDAFYVSACRKRDPSLVGIPIGIQQKALVATISYEARAAGVNKLDSIKEALKKCPDMVLVNGEDLTYFRLVSSQVWRLVRSVVWDKRVEKLGMDELFCDVTEMVDHHLTAAQKGKRWFDLNAPDAMSRDERYGFEYETWPNGARGHVYPESAAKYLDEALPDWWQERMLAAAQLAMYLRQRISDEVGLTCSAGIALNKSLAKLVGALNKPNQQTTFAPPIASPLAGGRVTQEDRLLHHINDFLDPLDLRKLPGYGRVVVEKIQDCLHANASRSEAQRSPTVPSNFMDANSISDEEIAAASKDAPKSKPRVTVGTARKMLSLQEMVDLFGDVTGPRLWALVCGRDAEPVVPAPDFPLQLSIEDTYPYPSLRGAAIHNEIQRLSLSLLRRLELELMSSDRSSTEGESARQPVDVQTDSVVVRNYEDDAPIDQGKRMNWMRYPLKLRLSVRQGWNNRISKQAPMPVEVFEVGRSRDIRAGAIAKACKALLRALIGGDDVVGDGMNLINIAALELSEKRPQRALGSFFTPVPAGTESKLEGRISTDKRRETIDMAMLASLPAELRAEIAAEYGLDLPGGKRTEHQGMDGFEDDGQSKAPPADSLICSTCGEAMEIWMQHDHELYPLLGLPVDTSPASPPASSRSTSPLPPSSDSRKDDRHRIEAYAQETEENAGLEQCTLCGEALRPWMLTAHTRYHEMEGAFG